MLAACLAQFALDEKDGLHPVLQPRRLRHELGALGDAAPLQHDVLGGHPHLGQELRRVLAGERRGVDLVGLHLGPGDCPNLHGVGDGHAMYEGHQQPNNDRRVAGRLQHDVFLLVSVAANVSTA
ncbi:hypothetical protein QTI66_39320 [Variovorax sp. J22R133]|nr:hypothetical protein [Variovorax sp. J22R133]MDM0118120.1 hypothetical protein [Variovorax sp. J22R133]